MIGQELSSLGGGLRSTSALVSLVVNSSNTGETLSMLKSYKKSYFHRYFSQLSPKILDLKQYRKFNVLVKGQKLKVRILYCLQNHMVTGPKCIPYVAMGWILANEVIKCQTLLTTRSQRQFKEYPTKSRKSVR